MNNRNKQLRLTADVLAKKFGSEENLRKFASEIREPDILVGDLLSETVSSFQQIKRERADPATSWLYEKV